MVETGLVGTLNATGPERSLTMAQLLDSARQVSGSDAALTWVDEDFLAEQDVVPYTEMPLWVPEADDAVDCSRAIAVGLTCRPLAETIRDTLAWDHTLPEGTVRRCGLPAEREAELLQRWHARS